jgi:hypothetical protein
VTCFECVATVVDRGVGVEKRASIANNVAIWQDFVAHCSNSSEEQPCHQQFAQSGCRHALGSQLRAVVDTMILLVALVVKSLM